MTSKEEILEYLKELKPQLEKDGIIKLGLFGSYARGEENEKSDIDIVLKTTDNFVKTFIGFAGFGYLDNLREKIINKFKLEVDICDIASMPKQKQERLLKGVIYV